MNLEVEYFVCSVILPSKSYTVYKGGGGSGGHTCAGQM
jgi:hypothetical protein